MSTEPFIGEIKIFGFDFAPKSYANCNGQLMPISQNAALFSLLGTTYGGNGQTTFGLPDLRGRMPIGQGSGTGLPSHSMGEIREHKHNIINFKFTSSFTYCSRNFCKCPCGNLVMEMSVIQPLLFLQKEVLISIPL